MGEIVELGRRPEGSIVCVWCGARFGSRLALAGHWRDAQFCGPKKVDPESPGAARILAVIGKGGDRSSP